MKFEQKLKIIVLILIIVLVSLMSFGGLFIQNNGKMVNLLPNYIKGMDLKGYRYITLEVAEDEENDHDNEEEKVEESAQTKEQQTEVDAKKDFINAKKIIEKRLKEMNVAQYTVAQDEQTGRVVINMVEDTATDTVIQYLYTTGNLTIEDPDGNVLLDSSQIKQVKTMYANTNNGTSIYLNIEFNKEGKEILRNISNEYRIPENTEEDTEEKTTENVKENTEESKEVTIKIDGAKVLSTQFEKEITNGSIQLSVGGATTSQAELQTYAKEAGYVEKILNNGALPVEYEVTANRYVKSNITADTYPIGIIVLTVIVLGAMIYLIVRYKKNGLLSSIAYIGYIAVLLLVIRYTNVIITIEGIFGLIISLAINYIINIYILNYINKATDKEEVETNFNRGFVKISIALIPVLILSVILILTSWLQIYSFAMIIFWGLAIAIIWNIILTKTLILNSIKE
ncbi:MAG: hypothetical protein U0N02_06125 [Clostridia bacterium]|jgi:preprotein translocase subunit SecD